MTDTRAMRTERDSMGELQVPADAYYGANTRRAELNFPISDLRFGRSFIQAIAQIKLCAAEVNLELGALDPEIAAAIILASTRVAAGEFDDEFVVDIFQTGSGTSTNMNANEVIANVANVALGGKLGSRTPVHPNDHVNKGQSSNDVIPSAIHVAACSAVFGLLRALDNLESALYVNSRAFWDVIKTGRTHLQDATPIRLGQEFLGYAGQVRQSKFRIDDALDSLSRLALGGTAVGTGIGTHPKFAELVTARLSEHVNLSGLMRRNLRLRDGVVCLRPPSMSLITPFTFSETDNHFQAQSSLDAIVDMSGALKTLAVSLMKICNDLRWLGSGPRAGIGEIALPEVQPGSSIMPGKVNPVIPESVCMVCAQVIGNDTTITIAGQSGNFELNVMMPVAAHNLLQSIDLLTTSCTNLTSQCINGITATTAGPDKVEQGLAMCTALAPIIGYDAAADIAHKAAQSGETIREVALRETDLDAATLDKALDPFSMTEPNPDIAAGG